ncbi:aspartyl-tRNA synthetase, cytoplasmic [Abortiporus biennis]|nr:aspartyl-tRNA synthetase, cytoplasmic [Abortiporus biennis]
MSSIKNLLHKVKPRHSKGSSVSSIDSITHPPLIPAQPATDSNGIVINEPPASSSSEDETTSNSGGTTPVVAPDPTKLQRPSDQTRERRLSFTQQKAERREERDAKNDLEAKARKEKQQLLHEQDPLRDRYGDLPEDMSVLPIDQPLDDLKTLATKPPGTRVAFRARVHHIRPLGSKIVFLILRHQLTTVQGVLAEEPNVVSHNMIKWTEGLNRESIVLVEGVTKEPPKEQGAVKSTSVGSVEVKVERLYVISAPTTPLPFQVDDVSRAPSGAATPRVGDKTRFNNRVLDLRSPPTQAIFRIRSQVCSLFRTALLKRHFLEIQSSKFAETATESGAAVFKVDYFRRPAFLIQSPQLAKEMCVAGDLERVFEIGPVFRAENSNTHRHLTEFTGLDLEMTIERSYDEVIDVIDSVFKEIFQGLLDNCREEIEVVKLHHPHEDLKWLDKTLRLKFSDGIKLLKESGFKEEDGSEPSEWEDLSSKSEVRLGELVKEKYGTDYYILDKFPLAVRPFYTMPDSENPKLSNAFDIFIRGEEVLSGGQRIHSASMLEKRMSELNVDPESMKDYLNGFRWGCPPHGGGGVGLERVVMLFLNLGDVRWASLFPRDPKSFAMNGQDLVEASLSAANTQILRGPESKTFVPGFPHGELPPLENLIAKYGDATNTSWVDPAWTIWRDQTTGAAVGYIPEHGFAVIFGSPLCEPNQIPRVVRSFLAYLESIELKPVWCCIDAETEKFLAKELGWSAIIAVAEERVNPTEADPANNDKTVRRKIHRAEREGVKIVEVEGEMDETVKQEIEVRCQEWSKARKGTQIHLTGVRPFDDMIHRKYFYATDSSGKICALVVLAQLSAKHGFQIKWALEFPGAPLGAIEYILTHVIKKLGDAGVRTATFGAGATGTFQPVEHLGGLKVKTLEKTYNGLSHTFHLLNKGDFRSKFGIERDPLYICYPKGGLGLKGVEAIMAMLQAPK